MNDVIVNVRTSAMTETDFIQVMDMPKPQFLALIRSLRTVKNALELRRGLQVGMTLYRKTHPVDDPRIWKAVQITTKLEKMARITYMYHKMKYLHRQNPQGTRKSRKIEAKRLWEEFVRANSY